MLPTPFDQNGDVDASSLKCLVNGARVAKCTGVVTLGVDPAGGGATCSGGINGI